jgi:AcrR family transcriptional regulator
MARPSRLGASHELCSLLKEPIALRAANAYQEFKRRFEKMAMVRRMTRPSDVTRERIMKAAERLFAESGYDGTSIRAIVAKAKVNQAAINYHFDGKDGLYREVLRGAFRALTEQQLTHAEELKLMSREEALSQFVRRQLQPLLGRDEYSRHMRIFNWETVQPTAVFRNLMAEEAAPFLSFAGDLVRRFMPDADQRMVTVAAIWLLGQCSVFVRNREQLAEPPVGLVLDEQTIEWLSASISNWVVSGLRPMRTN